MTRSVIVASMLVLFATPPAAAGEGRGAALGGAYASLAEGAEGMWWNPAVIGSAKLVSVSVGGALEGGNNALTITQIGNVATADEAAKAEIIEDIRTAGSWEARVLGGGGLAVSVWRVGVAYAPQAFVAAEGVSPDAAEFALNQTLALVPGKLYAIQGTYTRALFNRMSAGYAHEFLDLIPGLKLDAGAALAIFTGTDFERVSTAQVFTAGSGPLPAASSSRETATAGSGIAVDLGIRAKFLGGLVNAAVAARDLGAKMTWDATKESGSFSPATATWIATQSTGDAEMSLPSAYQVAAGASLPTGTSAGIAADFRTSPASAGRFRVGAEQSILGVITFRGGYQTAAGASPAMVTVGLGLGTPSILPLRIRADAALGIALDGKGGAAGVSAYAAF
jgi:hypothetical protein